MSTKLHTLRGSCLFLLFISQITCDWVEIEQNNYKPYRKLTINTGYDDHKSQVVPQNEETTKENKIYRNHSVEKLWSKGLVDRVSNIGNIKRIQGPTVKTTAIKAKQEDTEFSKNAPATEKMGDTHKYRERINIPQRHYYTNRPHILEVKNNQEEDFRIKESKHDKITNTGIKLASSIKSSVNNFQYDNYNEEKDPVVSINAPNKVKQMQTLRKNLSTNEKTKIHSNDENDEYYNSNYQRVQIGQRRTSPRPNIFNIEELTAKKHKTINKSPSIENYDVQNLDQLDDNKYTNFSLSRPFGAYITKINNTNENRNDFKKRPMIIKTDINSVPAINNEEEVPVHHQSVTEEMPTNSEDISKSKKKNPMDGMLKLMKVVSDTIYKNTHRSFKSKVKYLEGLKSTILTTIEGHVDTLWPDDKDHTRHTREARGHLEFPSSESALMSISFLTFAVFLIKLVLQVIHTYKDKTMLVAPTVVSAVGRAARAIRNQQ
ncbi:unnamed protein product, partial [Brenthis ino]